MVKCTTLRLTLSAPGVELLHGVVQADAYGGEAHLPLESRHQAIVKTPGPLGANHCGDSAHHSSILQRTFPFHFLRLSLDLASSERNAVVHSVLKYVLPPLIPQCVSPVV